MEFSKYKQEIQNNLPPNLDAGTVLHKIVRIQSNDFQLNGKETKGMRVFSIQEDNKEHEYRTSSGVIMNQLESFFKEHPTETLDKVKVVQPRGKQYLTLESL